jgi:hypothetical protein
MMLTTMRKVKRVHKSAKPQPRRQAGKRVLIEEDEEGFPRGVLINPDDYPRFDPDDQRLADEFYDDDL